MVSNGILLGGNGGATAWHLKKVMGATKGTVTKGTVTKGTATKGTVTKGTVTTGLAFTEGDGRDQGHGN